MFVHLNSFVFVCLRYTDDFDRASKGAYIMQATFFFVNEPLWQDKCTSVDGNIHYYFFFFSICHFSYQMYLVHLTFFMFCYLQFASAKKKFFNHTFSVACFLACIARILLRIKLRIECWKYSPMIYISFNAEFDSVFNDI